jgi:ubiquinone/menaquinone biosynthesis C-methylase UbiE
MSLSPNDWHNRFSQQAGWTRQARQYLFSRLGLKSGSRVLEAGCGTGAVLGELAQSGASSWHGLDIRLDYLQLAQQYVPTAQLSAGDAHHLPYAKASFEAACCHFLLLWVRDPLGVVAELSRVTRPGGAVLLLAEPDYGGRIDYPYELAIVGEWQSQALARAGANPQIGRRMSALLSRAGLVEIESGVLGGQWSQAPAEEDWQMEWQVLRADLEQLPSVLPGREADIAALQEIDRRAWQRNERVLYVPTFYAWGRKL